MKLILKCKTTPNAMPLTSKMHKRCKIIDIKANALTICASYKLSQNAFLNASVYNIYTSIDSRNQSTNTMNHNEVNFPKLDKALSSMQTHKYKVEGEKEDARGGPERYVNHALKSSKY